MSNLGDLDRLFAQIKREKGTLDIALRLDLRHQREGPPVHGAEGASADAGWCRDHPECIHRRQQGVADEQA